MKDYQQNFVKLYLTKDRKLDRRFKSNREFIKSNEWSRFNKFMQAIANRLGSPKVFGNSRLYWKHYLNPIYHIKQWWTIRKPIQVYGSDFKDNT